MEKQLSQKEDGKELAEAIIRLSDLLKRMERTQAREQGLTVLQSSLLQLCLEIEKCGAKLTPKLATERLFISAATISTALRTLEKKKLILRLRNKEDERSYFFQLSTPGRQKAILGKLYLNPLLKILEPIAGEQKELLRQFLNGLSSRMENVPL